MMNIEDKENQTNFTVGRTNTIKTKIPIPKTRTKLGIKQNKITRSTKKVKPVPQFRKLHQQWEDQLKKGIAENKHKITPIGIYNDAIKVRQERRVLATNKNSKEEPHNKKIGRIVNKKKFDSSDRSPRILRQSNSNTPGKEIRNDCQVVFKEILDQPEDNIQKWTATDLSTPSKAMKELRTDSDMGISNVANLKGRVLDSIAANDDEVNCHKISTTPFKFVPPKTPNTARRAKIKKLEAENTPAIVKLPQRVMSTTLASRNRVVKYGSVRTPYSLRENNILRSKSAQKLSTSLKMNLNEEIFENEAEFYSDKNALNSILDGVGITDKIILNANNSQGSRNNIVNIKRISVYDRPAKKRYFNNWDESSGNIMHQPHKDKSRIKDSHVYSSTSESNSTVTPFIPIEIKSVNSDADKIILEPRSSISITTSVSDNFRKRIAKAIAFPQELTHSNIEDSESLNANVLISTHITDNKEIKWHEELSVEDGCDFTNSSHDANVLQDFNRVLHVSANKSMELCDSRDQVSNLGNDIRPDEELCDIISSDNCHLIGDTALERGCPNPIGNFLRDGCNAYFSPIKPQ